MKTLLGAIATATTSSTPYKLAHPRKTHGKVRWTPEVSAAVEASKKAHYMWKEAGRPQGEHPLQLARKKNISYREKSPAHAGSCRAPSTPTAEQRSL